MPFLETRSFRCHYRVDGPESAPAIVLANSLGGTLAMWDEQVPALIDHYRVIRYDSRGHGQSSAPTGAYTIAELASDVLALLDALAIPHATFCGLSIGGMVGQWLGAHASSRFPRLVLCATAARFGTREFWDERIKAVQNAGLQGLVEATMERWFSAEFRARAPEVVERIRSEFLATTKAGYIGGCAALRDADLRGALQAIRAPTLLIGGASDPTATPESMKFLGDRIEQSRSLQLRAAHFCNIEAAPAFNRELLAFLGGTA
jgi:3-oxoadipate enol-lactonase